MFQKTRLIIFLAVLGIVPFAHADNLPITVDIALKKAFVPVGFDDNDRIQFAVTGNTPNTCYRVGPHALKVNEEDKTITVHQQAYLYQGVCLQILLPFTQVIDVGLLKSGTYTILDRQTGETLGSLPITRGENQGPDDFLYAPINDAHTQYSQGRNKLYITGTFSDRCSEFEDIRVLYQDQVLVVQPIIRRTIESTSTCSSTEKTRFLKTIDLKKGLRGTFFLHVRTLNGQAINKIVELF
jgi:hypothetical protein